MMKNKQLVVVLLAGGEGKRFWPITMGKSVIPFFGKPLIAHTLESLRLAGVTSAVIVTNSEDEHVIASLSVDGMTITTVVQKEPTGMADALMSARNAIGTRPCLIMNAQDQVDDALYEGLLKEMNDTDALVVGKRISSYFPGGYLVVKNDRLVGIVEKPGKGNEPSDLVNLVFHYFPDPNLLFTAIESVENAKDDIYEKALSAYAMRHPVRVIAYNGPWAPLKYPWHTLDIGEILLSRIDSYKGKGVIIKKNVIIEGPVYIEDGVKIFENTKIVGPCYIGRNTIIGNNCIIRASHIGADCVIGFNSDFTRSYIGDACWFHSNYVGDSILEGNISMGSGAVLANLRLDDGEISSVVKKEKLGTGRNKLGAIIGANTRIGVNASIMPGIKIGAHSFIGSGVVVDRDIPEQSFCVAKPGYTLKKNTRTASASRDEFKRKL